MRVYVAVRVKSHPADEGWGERLVAAARRALPFTTGERPEQLWRAPGHDVLLACWTNEPAQPDRPFLLRGNGNDGCVGVSGYTVGAQPDAVELVAGRSPDLAGVWSLTAATAGGIAAATCASGVEAVYYAETAEAVVVGNRALLVHLVADPSGPHHDLIGLAGVMSIG